MSNPTIAVLHPGEMGAAIGACLTSRGVATIWTSENRSAATAARAEAAGLESVESLDRALEAADIVLSICPPHAALGLAREVAARSFRGLYVDANAIAPATARDIARLIEAAGAAFVDGGVIGAPPTAKGRSHLYLSGKAAGDVAALFESTNLPVIVIEGPPGAASALKMAYAAWTKGSTALLAAIRALAQHHGIDARLIEEWKLSQPALPEESAAVVAKARKAWRWVAEMNEIAASFEAAGLPGGFHHAAAEIYERLAPFTDGTKPPSLKQVTDALLQGKAANARSLLRPPGAGQDE